jgi:hypothetical protein
MSTLSSSHQLEAKAEREHAHQQHHGRLQLQPPCRVSEFSAEGVQNLKDNQLQEAEGDGKRGSEDGALQP